MAFPFNDDDEGSVIGSDIAPPPPEESNNRTFLIAAGVLGGLVFLALICLAGYALIFVPRNQAAQATQQAQINFNNTQVAAAFTATAQVLLFTPTSSPTETPTPSVTPVLAQPTDTQAPDTNTPDPITQTVAAAYTQAALAQLTIIPTSTALLLGTQVPQTGFADEVGLPGLLGLTVVLVAIIFLARRMRQAPLSR
jgi:hypothetical protein